MLDNELRILELENEVASLKVDKYILEVDVEKRDKEIISLNTTISLLDNK